LPDGLGVDPKCTFGETAENSGSTDFTEIGQESWTELDSPVGIN
jgi:hypothetical protein